MNRKAFIELSVGAGAGLWLVGCGPEDATQSPDLGNGGTGGSGSDAGGGSPRGGAGAGGTGGAGGTAGAAAGGTGGGAGGSVTAGSGSVSPGGTGGGAGSGTSGGAGQSAGGGGTSGAGMGGKATGGAGSGGVPMGGAGSPAGGLGGVSGGGTGGMGSGGTGGGTCSMLTISQNEGGETRHDHIPSGADAIASYCQTLMDHINGPTATTMPFTVFLEGAPPGHTHDLLFTQSEIDTLRAGGQLPAKSIEPDDREEVHVYKIGCQA